MNTAWDLEHEARKARIAASPERKRIIEAAYEVAPHEWRDFTFQHSTRGPNLADKEVVAEMLTSYTRGRLAFFFIEVGEEPSPNKDKDGNTAKLADLPHPLHAAFDTGTVVHALDCDGFVAWREPMEMVAGDKIVAVDPRAVPLEVGYMPSGKASYGLRRTGLARWPYGSTMITVAVPLAALAAGETK
jgi:hypothetical protein